MTVCREAVHHRPKSNFAYAVDEETIRLRLRSKRGNLDACELLYADKFDWPNRERCSMRNVRSDSRFDYWEAEITPPNRRLCYAFRLEAGEEALWLTEWGFESADENDLPTLGTERALHYFEYPFLNAGDVIDPPDWVSDAVFYQIFPERFANGDPERDPADVEEWGGSPDHDSFFGGDLQGVIDNLDYLDDLGVTALYLTPIFESESNHKYNTTDYRRIDPHFGDEETLSRLVDAAHERGIRVMLDAVFNHCGRQFEPFRDVIENGRDSEYVDWFHVHEFPIQFEPRPSYDTFAFEGYMPKLNTENPEVRSYLIDVATYWIEETGIDGWRLDVADEVDHQFWREFRRAVKEVEPDAYILGEIWHDSRPWLQGDQFDSVMNYPFMYAVDEFLDQGTMNAADFADKVDHLLTRYPEQTNEVLFNLLGSHDTARLLHRFDGDARQMRVALLVLLTFRGTPCIYYGDEVGMTGGEDPDCRRPMIWDESERDGALRQYTKDLIDVRTSHDALRRGELTFVRELCREDLLVYRRGAESSTDPITVAVNRGDAPVDVPASVASDGGVSNSDATILVQTGQVETRQTNGLELRLPPRSGVVWR